MVSEASAALPAVAAMLQTASDELGYDVLDLIQNGE
jgi:hypothetical protein